MKTLRRIITNLFYTFSVLSILFGILCEADVLENLPYSKVVFPLLLMSLCTTLFVALRETVIPEASRLKHLLDVAGCSVIILLIGHFVGWLEVSVPYFLMICGMVLVVYLFVWLITWLQSKHDEEALNRLLLKQEDETKQQIR